MFKKLIGSKAFYKAVFAIALPMIIQNVITNFVNLLDNIMVGQLGTAQMSGVSVVNIDNGFGAGYLANMINHMEVRK